MTDTRAVTGTYRPCRICQAPIRQPFPDDWDIELVKEGPPRGPVRSFITPHAVGCTAPYADPDPGVALRLPGWYVTGAAFDMRPGAGPDGDPLTDLGKDDPCPPTPG